MIFDLLEDLHRSHRLTSVLVTHNPDFRAALRPGLQLETGGWYRWNQPVRSLEPRRSIFNRGGVTIHV